MAEWHKRVGFGPDAEVRAVEFFFTPQEIDLLSVAIEQSALGAEPMDFTPSEGIRLSRIHAMLDNAADWVEGGE